MEPAFEHLPREKQLRILNAAMKVFARNDYRHASTDDIAAQAGISKGLLFYYYYNKFGQESRTASPAFPPSRA